MKRLSNFLRLRIKKLPKKNFVIISACKSDTPEKNFENTINLMKDLDDKYFYELVIGNYGENEISFIVYIKGKNYKPFLKLAKKYNQESILVNIKGQAFLVNSDGVVIMNFSKFVIPKEKPQDYFTYYLGWYFKFEE